MRFISRLVSRCRRKRRQLWLKLWQTKAALEHPRRSSLSCLRCPAEFGHRRKNNGASLPIVLRFFCLAFCMLFVNVATVPFLAPVRAFYTTVAACAPLPAVSPFKLEATFSLPGVTGNPFDYRDNDVQVRIVGPNKSVVSYPAFYDGGDVWRVRIAPRTPGHYRIIGVFRNGADAHPSGLAPSSWTVAPSQVVSGFVRRDPSNSARFVFENGRTYYPVGHNAAWKGGNDPDVPELLTKMGRAGENWSRVWMNHWDNKNLDWKPDGKGTPGTLDLDVAKRWDTIVDAAQKSGVHFQMVLQHHGQYSTQVNPNWGENPWNRRNGGFLDTPEAFFTDERARALTRAKYRYILARWGYSPAILAWELFNEVQFTDALRVKKDTASVVAWHREMAQFLRTQDPYHHLVTTSSDTDIVGLYDTVDYVQPHAYPPDGVATVQSARPQTFGKPIFFGEIGPSGDLNRDDGTFLHNILWASLASESSGTAQYWAWDLVDSKNLYGQFTSVSAFLRASDLPSQMARLRPATITVQTPDRGSLSFGPGGGWGKGQTSVFPISANGVQGTDTMPAYLQGRTHADLFSRADFPLELDRPADFRVTFKQAAKAGAHVRLLVEETVAAEHDFAQAAQDTNGETTLTAHLPAGHHTVRLDNTGPDWAVIERVTLAPFGPTLRVLGKADTKTAVLWIRNTRPETVPSEGTITVSGFAPGTYQVIWWDTWAGRELRRASVTVAPGKTAKPLVLTTPSVTRDVAVFVRPR